MTQVVEPLTQPRTPAQTALHLTTKTAIIGALISVWAIQYLLWVPTVWTCRMSVAIIGFALCSTGHMILLFIPIFGWFWLAYLLIRDHPDRARGDRGYLRPWFRSALAS